jgi:hypothetical protein
LAHVGYPLEVKVDVLANFDFEGFIASIDVALGFL